MVVDKDYQDQFFYKKLILEYNIIYRVLQRIILSQLWLRLRFREKKGTDTYIIEYELPKTTIKHLCIIGNWLDDWTKTENLKCCVAKNNSKKTHNRWKITLKNMNEDSEFKFVYVTHDDINHYAYTFDDDGNPIEKSYVNNNLTKFVDRPESQRFGIKFLRK